MAVVKPFAAIRPADDKADKIAALPYDVYNRAEAREVVKGDNLTFLRIDRPETFFADDYDMYAPEVYKKAREEFDKMLANKDYIREDKKVYYIYELIMDGRSQTGIVGCSSIDDYASGTIKKHENTREEKEIDRINHVDNMNAQTGPIFLAYRKNDVIKGVIAKVKAGKPLYAFTSDDGITHNVWVVSEDADINAVMTEFENIDSIYIADGHHRAASAVKVGIKRRNEAIAATGSYDENAEYNYFLSVLFPDEELKILPYNRVVKDLNGLSEEEFMDKIASVCSIEKVDAAYMPEAKGELGMYISNQWYKLTINKELMSEDPVEGLDVSLLQNNILNPILGIEDPRTSNRIDFVGGIRGLKELEKRATSDMILAFSMYPTSIQELFDVADQNRLMPPKSTWFEPKLRSGIFIHELS